MSTGTSPVIHESISRLTRPIGEVRVFDGNPRRGNVEAIEESLSRWGQYRPIVATVDGQVIAGNHTLMAARELGWDSLAVAVVDVDEETAKRIMLADNRTSDMAGYDDEALLAALRGLPDLVGTGWSDADMAGLLASLEVSGRSWRDRPLKEVDGDPVAKRGQRWRLGPHVLVCGDSTEPGVWSGLEGGGQLLVTDPPYGIGYGGSLNYARSAISGDGSGADAAALLGRVLDVLPLVEGGLSYVFTTAGKDGVAVQSELVARGLMRWGLVWVKNWATLGRSDYQQMHELVVHGVNGGDGVDHEVVAYGWQPGGAHVPVKDRRHSTVLTCPRPASNPDHPTQKPVELLRGIMAAHELPVGSWVLEPFAGSGSTLVAAHLEGLRCYAVEVEPAYCDVILQRWLDGTGIEPVEVC